MYSKTWQDLITNWESHPVYKEWETIYKTYYDPKWNIHENIIIFEKGVWFYYGGMGDVNNNFVIRKARAITRNDVIYDGSYHGLYTTVGIGSLDHKFSIDDHIIDLTHEPLETRQEKLFDFFKKYGNAVDSSLPKVPKGILKL